VGGFFKKEKSTIGKKVEKLKILGGCEIKDC
jgi:hypothetical protein